MMIRNRILLVGGILGISLVSLLAIALVIYFGLHVGVVAERTMAALIILSGVLMVSAMYVLVRLSLQLSSQPRDEGTIRRLWSPVVNDIVHMHEELARIEHQMSGESINAANASSLRIAVISAKAQSARIRSRLDRLCGGRVA